MNVSDERWVQIGPATPGLVAVHGLEDGTEMRTPVVLFALRADGEVVADESIGLVDCPVTDENFKRFEHHP
jgi:hypothetical protein